MRTVQSRVWYRPNFQSFGCRHSELHCVPKNVHLLFFCITLSKLTDFNDVWQVKSSVDRMFANFSSCDANVPVVCDFKTRVQFSLRDANDT